MKKDYVSRRIPSYGKNRLKKMLLSMTVMLSALTASAQFPSPYCTVAYGSGVEPITLVNFAGINNTSSNVTGGDALQDFTAVTANVVAGLSYPMTIKCNTVGNFTSKIVVFIDWNHDGDFLDADETFNMPDILESTGLDAIESVGSIQVPVTALAGNTRMRVAKKFSSTPASCNTGGFGESEDYTVFVTIPTCPSVTGVTASGVTANSAVIAWTENGSATNWDIEYGVLGFTSTGIPTTSVTNNPATLLGLTSNTSYQYYVRANCGPLDQSTWMGPFNFSTKQVPAVVPFVDDFSSNAWTLVNGTEINKWFVGSAAGNPVNGLYISNNNGVANAYTITTASVTQAYRDITFPVGLNTYNLSFDWKASGQTTVDYLRVWIVPTTSTIAAGTKISTTNTPGAVQLGVILNLSATWVTGQNFVLPSYYAGTTARLVFEWVNNANNGNQTPAAIDNLNVSIISCSAPTALTATGITATTANVAWTENGTATTWDIEYGVVGFIPTGTPTVSVTANPAIISSLTANTSYEYYVRANCGADQSVWAGPFVFTTTQVPAVVPFVDDFSANEWGIVNGTQTNTWFIGSAAGNPVNGLYISNDNGVSNAYTVTTASVTQAYRDIAFPSGVNTFNLNFDWKASGQTTVDYLRVWMVPTSSNINAGTQITTVNTPGAVQLGGILNLSGTWVIGENFVLPNTYAGTTGRLVFEWINNATNGTQTPAAIDNVSISVISCPAPTALSATGLTGISANLSWTENGITTDWDIEYGATGFTPTGVPTVSVTTNPATIAGLTASTIYQYYVRANCGSGQSLWTGPFSFTTTQIQAVVPFTDDFSSNEWGTVNGTQNNKWYVGSAAGNPADGLYISNDNGISNLYSLSGVSITHAFRDVLFPAGGNQFNLSFDWKALGEISGSTYYDYFRVWVVPSSATITAGTQITTGNTPGAVQLGGSFNNSNAWVIGQNLVIPASFSGTSSRIVFQWRNDASGGAQTPACIDNLSIYAITCPAPSGVTASNITPTSADLTWIENGSSQDWEIQYGVGGFVPNTGASIATSSNPYAITGLQPASTYRFYVRTRCSSTDSSTWTGPYIFTTLCAPITALPWTENFDFMPSVDYDLFPPCWNAEAIYEWYTGNGPSSSFNAGSLSGSNYLAADYYTDSKIWTPEFSLVAGETYEFSFNWAGDDTNPWEGSVHVKNIQAATENMIGTKFIEIGDLTSMTYKKETYCFTPTTSGSYAFGVYILDDLSSFDNDHISFDDFGLKQVVTVPGIDGTLSVCQTGTTVDLNTVITTTIPDGTWSFGLNPNAVNAAGMFNAASVPVGVHQFLYITGGCVADTTIATMTVVEASSAGNDGSIAVCRNQPFNLVTGLSGSTDLGGVWTNPNAVVVPNGNAVASNIPGQYNYKYIVNNGVCPNDTAKVVVNVQGCDYLGLEDVAFEGFNMYPNPTSDIVFISNSGSTEVFNYEVLDMNGRVILKANKAINGSKTTELDLSKVQVGVYMVRVFNENADKTFRVVKN